MKQIITGLSLIFFGLMSSPLWAERLIGSILNNIGIPSSLVELNPLTGKKIKIIGNIGYRVNGMAYDAVTNTLYATTSARDTSFPNGLISIDLTTGAGSPIGSTIQTSQGVNNLAINSTGQFFSIGWINQRDHLVEWDIEDGLFTSIGEIGVFVAQHGLSFDNVDTLFLINGPARNLNISHVDTASGTITSLGDFLDYENHIAHHGDFHPTSNLYYGLDASRRSQVPDRNIFVIHTGTNSIIRTIPTEDNLHTLAFIPTPIYGAGECNGTKGIDILDIICTINIVLGNSQ